MSPGHETPDLLQVEVTHEAGALVVRPRGELDLSTSGRLAAALQRAIDGDKPVTLDLSQLTFMDASGLKLALDVSARLGDRLTLRPAPPRVQRLFMLTGLIEQLPFAEAAGEPATADEEAENLHYVRRLWQTFMAGGMPALLQLAPRQVEWRSAELVGASGPDAMRTFWSDTLRGSHPGDVAVSNTFELVGGDVIVRSELPAVAGRRDVSWSLYVFEGRTLIRAVTFRDASAARRHAGDGAG